MYSDKWLKLGFKHGDRIKVSAVADYYVWTNSVNIIEGVTVNFKEADDYHYELQIEEWMKFQIEVLKSNNFDETKELFALFLHENNEMFAFQDALNLHEIKYVKIAFY